MVATPVLAIFGALCTTKGWVSGDTDAVLGTGFAGLGASGPRLPLGVFAIDGTGMTVALLVDCMCRAGLSAVQGRPVVTSTGLGTFAARLSTDRPRTPTSVVGAAAFNLASWGGLRHSDANFAIFGTRVDVALLRLGGFGTKLAA